MTFAGSGLGAAGTRVTKRLGPGDEIWTYVWQSIVGACAVDLTLTLILVGCMIAGWWSLSLFLAVVGFLVGVIVLVFGRPAHWIVRALFGNLWGVGAIIGLVVGRAWYAMIANGAALIWKQLSAVGLLPWWVYATAGLALVVTWIKLKWRAMVVLSVLLVLGGIVVLSDGVEWLEAWHSLKHLLIPYSWPVIGFALLLALVMGKEMLFPSLEWTFDPVSLEELKEVGLIGLWAPGLFSKSVENTEPDPERTVRAEHRETTDAGGAQEDYAFLPDSREARNFYKAISKGAPFALTTARRCHVSRRVFENKIRKAFLERKWAKWKNEKHHDQGVELRRAGQEMIEELVLNDPRG